MIVMDVATRPWSPPQADARPARPADEPIDYYASDSYEQVTRYAASSEVPARCPAPGPGGWRCLRTPQHDGHCLCMDWRGELVRFDFRAPSREMVDAAAKYRRSIERELASLDRAQTRVARRWGL